MNVVRTRFAPSPTGNLHIGGARTALFCWAYARHFGGQFVLRIEDTDTQRSKDEFVESIIDGLSWLGMNPDDEIVFQSQRQETYKKYIDKLMQEGKAYKCYCSNQELDEMRQEQIGQGKKAKYDGRCYGKDDVDGSPFVIRFRMPKDGNVSFHDEIRGNISVENSELDDFVIVRSDGTPTYNFCVVIDDNLLEISHVVRGDDHINNTPKQIHIFQALGFDIPKFAHLPMIHGDDGKKLSKRHGALDVMEYFDQGFLPQALINFLVRLGWSYNDKEKFSSDEIISLFSFSSVSRSPAIFSYKKLLWVNQQYIQGMDIVELKNVLSQYDADLVQNENILQALELYRPRAQTLLELLDFIRPVFGLVNLSNELEQKYLDGEAKSRITEIYKELKILEKWDVLEINDLIKTFVKNKEIPFAKIGKPLRVAMLGVENSPDLGQVMLIIGRHETLQRLNSYCVNC